ncbi:MAG: hypothetical protein K0R72_439 [Clostridia bacterium]|nr:hypothetical protein [Clostridia bacterium]
MVHLYINGEEIKTTLEHPFWILDKGWVEAKNLRENDRISGYSNTISYIEKVSIEHLKK